MSLDITTMNRGAADHIGERAYKALQAEALGMGLTLNRERGLYDPGAGTFTFKGTFVCKTESGIPSDFVRYAEMYGFGEKDYNRLFRTCNGKYRLIGFKPNARKYKVLGKCESSGKTYKFTLDTLKRALDPVVPND